ncbi:hypothetical protein [Homoserinimonas sp. A520]
MTKNAAATLIAAALTVSLAACSTEQMFPELLAEPASTPTQEPAPDPLDLDGNGSVSEFEKQMAAQNAPREFIMPDGSVVIIDPREPMPPAVKEVIAQQAIPVVAPAKSNRDFSPESVEGLISEVRDYATAQAEATGISIVIVFSKPNGSGQMGWGSVASSRQSTGVVGGLNRDEVVSRVQSWADQTDHELIVID